MFLRPYRPSEKKLLSSPLPGSHASRSRRFYILRKVTVRRAAPNRVRVTQDRLIIIYTLGDDGTRRSRTEETTTAAAAAVCPSERPGRSEARTRKFHGPDSARDARERNTNFCFWFLFFSFHPRRTRNDRTWDLLSSRNRLVSHPSTPSCNGRALIT